MAGHFSNIVSIDEEIKHCARREREERNFAIAANGAAARAAHLALAKRYADRARSLKEYGNLLPN